MKEIAMGVAATTPEELARASSIGGAMQIDVAPAGCGARLKIIAIAAISLVMVPNA